MRVADQVVDSFLYGDAKAPRNSPTSIYNCLWCEASHDFAAPMVGVRRAPGVRLHAAQVAARGSGVASAAATAYDGAAAVRQAARLHEQGNDTGARSHIVGAVSRSVGGLGGVALGASAGAAVTSETGPGALIGGAVGGIAGAVAGDELAAWMDHRRIYRQTDGDGHRWHFDPVHPSRSWTRTVTDNRSVAVPTQQTASPELADRLDYQASSRAVELALSAPSRAQDPYLQPATLEEHRPGLLYEGDWRRDAESGQWSRQVTDSHVGVSMQIYRTEVAGSQRAAELDRQARAIVAKNLEAMPAALASDYKDAYERFGWARHGGMPEAVHNAMQHPQRMIASDGRAYDRDDDRRWTTPGMLYGSQTADTRIHTELEAAYRQRTDQNTVSVNARPLSKQAQADVLTDAYFAAMEVGDRDGMRKAAKAFAASDAGAQVRADVVQEMLDEQRALPGRDHPLFIQAMTHLRELGPETARYRDDAGLERMAGAIACEAKRHRMGGIDAIVPGENGELVATWTNPWQPLAHDAARVDPTLAAIQPLDRSFQQLSEETRQQDQQAQQAQREQATSQGRGMSR